MAATGNDSSPRKAPMAELQPGCPYELLGVSQDASPRSIEKAWRQQARLHHPDKVAEEDKATAEANFKRLAQAHEVLADPERRRLYDLHGIQDEQGLRPRRHQPPGWENWEDDDDCFGIDEEELQELLRAFFGATGGARPRAPARTADDVREGLLGFAFLGACAGVFAGLAWLLRRPTAQAYTTWIWWQWRFLLHDLGLR
eukprot:TRINITY_DN43929_c0_g1_i1.p1 TRINITY_DN43929_c0_g1~~TRINITY_DN43929_c0_g1_i1.p1  ORF type:complete len:200 (-),score=49.24 TRINITY_DN43929_c0_g1_i1:36-635(-)